MPSRDARILVDTNAIRAAHQVGCWNAIRKYYKLETADFCIKEAVCPNRTGKRLVNRTAEELRKELHAHAVTDTQRAALAIALQGRVDLDDGELDLLSLANSFKEEIWWLCGPDKATLRAMNLLGILEKMCSLQLLAEGAGAKVKSWEHQYTEKWLSSKRTMLQLGMELI
jgi:hypothetical protein